MIDNLLIVWRNNYGLTRDAALIGGVLSALGQIKFVETKGRGLWARCFSRKIARRAFHFERVHRIWFSAAHEHVLIPNQEHFPLRHLPRLKRISKVFAKTRHAEEIFNKLGMPTVYIGFTSQDCLLNEVEKDWSRFFHLAGASIAKGTESILKLWGRHPEWPELVLVQKEKRAPAKVPPNVTLISEYLDDRKLQEIQNACGVHLCPSRAEGWGHYLIEALSCGAVVVTTDAPPMNEHIMPECGIMVPYAAIEPRNLGTYYHVDEAALERTIQNLIDRPDAEKADLGQKARERYLAIDSAFHARIAGILA